MKEEKDGKKREEETELLEIAKVIYGENELRKCMEAVVIQASDGRI